MIFQSKPNEKSFAAEKWSEKRKKDRNQEVLTLIFCNKVTLSDRNSNFSRRKNGSLTNFLQ